MHESVLPSGLHSRTEGALRILVHSNRQARNAFTPALYEQLPLALQEAAADPAIAAVVLAGDGDFFCAGGDLRQLARRGELPPGERRARLEPLHALVRAIRACPKPVIAAVEGGAAGAGVTLALACDMLVAAREAAFTLAYVKVGLSPDGGATAFLAQCMPRHLVTQLCLSGERFTAERLHAFGVVARLAAEGEAVDEAKALAHSLANGPSRAMARIKRLCDHAYGASLEEQLELEASLMVESQGDPEAREGISAFFAKRSPDFAALRRRT